MTIKLIALSLFVALAPTFNARPGSQDNRCTLKVTDAPELRGFRLGMTEDAANKLLPLKLSFAPDGTGVRAESFTGAELRETKAPRFEGVDEISLKYLDGRIYFLEVVYGDTQLRDTAEFIAKLSDTFGLPVKAWKGGFVKSLLCDGFGMTAYSTSLSSRVGLLDVTAAATIERREAELKEKKRRNFKP